MVQSDAEVIKDLKAEVAALRRVIDNNNAKIAISSMQMNEMKTRVAKLVVMVKDKGDSMSLRRHPLERQELSVLVCKDVLEDDLRASAAPEPMMAAPSALDIEKDALAAALAKACRERDSAREQASGASASLVKAKHEVKELKATVRSLQQEMVVMQGGAPSESSSSKEMPKDDAVKTTTDGTGGGGWWQWLIGAAPLRSEGEAHLEARHAQLVLALWGMAAALSESENVRAMDVEARALAPTDTTEATGMYRSLDKLKAKGAQFSRYPSSSVASSTIFLPSDKSSPQKKVPPAIDFKGSSASNSNDTPALFNVVSVEDAPYTAGRRESHSKWGGASAGPALDQLKNTLPPAEEQPASSPTSPGAVSFNLDDGRGGSNVPPGVTTEPVNFRSSFYHGDSTVVDGTFVAPPSSQRPSHLIGGRR